MPSQPSPQSDHIIECRGRYLAKLVASGRTQVPRGKAKRKHPKRHGENKERSCIARAKSAKAKAAQSSAVAEHRRRVAIERAYWRGEIEDLSGY